jgi:hypothetical protein
LPSTGNYVPYPTYFAEELASKIIQNGGLVVSTTSSDTNLSAYAVYEPTGDVDLLVINKSSTDNLTGTFNFTGFTPCTNAAYWQYGKAEDTAQSHTTDGHASLTAGNSLLTVNGSSFSYTFPSYSMTVLDIPSATMTVLPSNLPPTGTAYLTLKIGVDSKLHIYQTGTTTDIVPSMVFANVTSVYITGRDNYADVLTVDFSNGNPIPSEGVSFNGGAGGGNTLIVAGTSGGDNVTMTDKQITDDSYAPIIYSNVDYFGFGLGGGSDSLLVNGGTLKINQDNAISASTNVTINGGTLDLNGYSDSVGNVTLVSGSILNGTLPANSYTIDSGTVTAALPGPGTLLKTTTGQASITSINNANTAINAGNLSANSITTGTLTLGAGAVLTINPIPGGPAAAINASASSNASTGGVAPPTSDTTSTLEPITTSGSASAANVTPSLQQPPASVNVEKATIPGSSVDLISIPSPPISGDASASPNFFSTTSTNDLASPVRLLDSQSRRQIDFLAASSLFHLPFNWRLDFEVSDSQTIEGQFLKLISDQQITNLKDVLTLSTQDGATFRPPRAKKTPAVPINDAHSFALYSIIQDFHVDNSNGQIYFDLPLRACSQKQIGQFVKAVDTLFAICLL